MEPKEAMSSFNNEPIAIVGMGCRLPGGVNNIDEFWQLLVDGVDAICNIPQDRWDVKKFYNSDPEYPGKMNVKQGGFLVENVWAFDPLFFGISPREVMTIDPQQRLLLEVTWEALENAGIGPSKLVGSDTGVFVGGFCLDGKLIQLSPFNREQISNQTATSCSMTLLANRISHNFDFRGPSLTVDTACSSSLLAIHLACQSLWHGDCSVAVAGGVNLMLIPEYFIVMCKGKFLAPHARCKAFSEEAQGYVRGEGAGVIVLKPLSKALADKDPIHALIKATATNQDGKTLGISLPNQQSQEALMKRVYEQSGVAAADIDYIEAHGTGTQAGDLAETNALHNILSQNRATQSKCMIGSVKTNIGHLEAAAGVVGLIKASLCLQKEKVPPNLHFDNPNPKIPFDKMCIKVPIKLESLNSQKALHAGVNSFGYGGSNAHVLLQQHSPSPQKEQLPFLQPLPITISAKGEKALQELVVKYRHFTSSKTPLSLENLCYSTTMRRDHHSHRLTIVATSPSEIKDKLQLFLEQKTAPGLISHVVEPKDKRKLLFVYTGMGPQWWAMGRELLEQEPVFREAINQCDNIFSEIAPWSLLKALTASEQESKIKETDVAQPTNLAIQVALTELWKHWGIEPDAIVGHSIGEVAAAYAAGALSLQEALLVSFYRGKLQNSVSGAGTMLAIELSELEASALVDDFDEVTIAAINSPCSVTLSGTQEQLQAIADILEEHCIFCRFLQVEVAFHSPQMDEIKQELLTSLKGLQPQTTKIPLYSTVTGEIISGKDLTEDYWWNNVRQPVRFAPAIETLIKDEFQVFLEIGPHPVLSNAIKECVQEKKAQGHFWHSLHRKKPEKSTMLEALAHLYGVGFDVSWSNIVPPHANYISLPTYPWQKEVYWQETSQSKQDRYAQHKRHAFLYEKVNVAQPTWQVELNDSFFPYLKDHRIDNHIIFPGAGYIELGLALHQEIHQQPSCVLQNLKFHQMLMLENNKNQILQSSFNVKTREYSVYSCAKQEKNWVLHASGKVFSFSRRINNINLDEINKRCPTAINRKSFYRQLAAKGLNYGPSFQSVAKIWKGQDEVLAQIENPGLGTEKHILFHPVLLDACFQSLIIAVADNKKTYPFIPVSIEKFIFHTPPTDNFFCYGKIEQYQENKIVATILICDNKGKVIIDIQGLKCQAIKKEKQKQTKELFYDFDWQESKLIAPLPYKTKHKTKTWLILAEKGENLDKLATYIQSSDINAMIVCLGESQTKIADNYFEIPKKSKEDIQRLVKDISYEKIIYLVGSNTKRQGDATQQTIDVCMPLLYLVQSMAKNKKAKIGVVTQSCQMVSPKDNMKDVNASSLWGLANVVENELSHINCQAIDVLQEEFEQHIELLFQELLSNHKDVDVAYRNEKRFIKQLSKKVFQENVAQKQVPMGSDTPVKLELEQRGNLNSLQFHQTTRRSPGPSEVEIKLYASPINFKDLLKAMGELSTIATENTFFGEALGMEGAGKIVALGENVQDLHIGDEVIVPLSDSFRSYVTVATQLVVPKPKNLDFFQAPVLLGFITAYYSFVEIAQMQKGEKVLIHNATGGVGLAAIQVAKWLGAEIFATAGSEEKRDYLRQLGIDHVMDSRSLHFIEEIKNKTNGYGVDVVLNALAGEIMNRSFELLAPYGRFLEIGKKDITEDNPLAMRPFNNNTTFAGVDIDRFYRERPEKARKILMKLIQLFDNATFQAIPITKFAWKDVKEAFKFMAQSKHIGKIIIDMHQQEVPVVIKAQKEFANGTYIVTGGTKGFGLAIARWLLQKGANKLILISRSGACDHTINSLKNGAEVIVKKADITNEVEVAAIISEIDKTQPPLKGIIHGAMVLNDGFILDFDEASFAKVILPKVKGCLLLHQYTQHMHLDFFILLSSISSIIGNRGQGNYVAANAFLDNFAYFRRSLGLTATTINLGMLSQVGVAARNEQLKAHLEKMGMKGLSTKEALQALEIAIKEKPTQIGAFNISWSKWGNLHSSRFRKFAKHSDDKEFPKSRKEQLFTKLSSLSSSEKKQQIERIITEEMAIVLRLSSEKINVHQSIKSIGVDSLLVLEFKNSIQANYGLEFSTAEILKGPSIQQIAQQVLDEMPDKK